VIDVPGKRQPVETDRAEVLGPGRYSSDVKDGTFSFESTDATPEFAWQLDGNRSAAILGRAFDVAVRHA
jgi:hypothetical protein